MNVTPTSFCSPCKKQRIDPRNPGRDYFRVPFSDDLVLELFRALSIREILNASKTCRRFRQIASRDNKIKVKLLQHNIFQKCITIFLEFYHPELVGNHLLRIVKLQVHCCVEEALLTAKKMRDRPHCSEALCDEGLMIIGDYLLERDLLSRVKEIGKAIHDARSRSEFFYRVGVKELENSPHTVQVTAHMISNGLQRDRLQRKIALRELETNPDESKRIARRKICDPFLQSEVLSKATIRDVTHNQAKIREAFEEIKDWYWFKKAYNRLDSENRPPWPAWETYVGQESRHRDANVKMHALEALDNDEIEHAKQLNEEIFNQKDYNDVVTQTAIKEASFDVELALSELPRIKDEPTRSREYRQDQMRLEIVKVAASSHLAKAKTVANLIVLPRFKFHAWCFIAIEERSTDPDRALENLNRAKEEARRDRVYISYEYRDAIFQIALACARTDKAKAEGIIRDHLTSSEQRRMALVHLEAHFNPRAAVESIKRAIARLRKSDIARHTGHAQVLLGIVPILNKPDVVLS